MPRSAKSRQESTIAGQVLETLKVPGAAGLCDGQSGRSDFLRLWPHRHATDGFFAAAWVRK